METKIVDLVSVHRFETHVSHSQVCDSLSAINDFNVVFHGKDGVYLLQTNSRRAFLCISIDDCYSVHGCKHGSGLFVAACGGKGLRVAYLELDGVENRMRVVAQAGEPSGRAWLMTNHVRLIAPIDQTQDVILTRCLNSQEGIQQYRVKLHKDQDPPALSLTMVVSLPSRDYINSFSPLMFHDGTGGIMPALGDGFQGNRRWRNCITSLAHCRIPPKLCFTL